MLGTEDVWVLTNDGALLVFNSDVVRGNVFFSNDFDFDLFILRMGIFVGEDFKNRSGSISMGYL